MGYVRVKIIIAILLIAFAFHNDDGACPRGNGVGSSSNLISGSGEFLKSGGGDQLVYQ